MKNVSGVPTPTEDARIYERRADCIPEAKPTGRNARSGVTDMGMARRQPTFTPAARLSLAAGSPGNVEGAIRAHPMVHLSLHVVLGLYSDCHWSSCLVAPRVNSRGSVRMTI